MRQQHRIVEAATRWAQRDARVRALFLKGSLARGQADERSDVAWQQPHTFIGFYEGPLKVDFFFQEHQPAVDPWLREGFRALFDPDEVAGSLRRKLERDLRSPDLSDFDVHAWDWL